jgi:hypothetical protein
MMLREIENRQHSFKPYGVAFTRTTGRRERCNPVWYIDITPGKNWLTAPVNQLVEDAVARATGADGVLDKGDSRSIRSSR